MIRQGVAGQDRQAVRSALELARQLQTPIEQPILDMLKKWLGEEAFNAAMAPKAASQGSQPPLVLIREGVAAQNKDAVRSALRLAVEQESHQSKLSS